VHPASEYKDPAMLLVHALQEQQRQDEVGQEVNLPSHLKLIGAHRLLVVSAGVIASTQSQS